MFLCRVVVDSANIIQKLLTFVIKRDGVTEKGPEKGFEKLLGGELTGISNKDEYLKGVFLMVRPFVTDPEKKKKLIEALLRAAELFAHDAGCNKVCSCRFLDGSSYLLFLTSIFSVVYSL
jgi:hypothetical protein